MFIVGRPCCGNWVVLLRLTDHGSRGQSETLIGHCSLGEPQHGSQWTCCYPRGVDYMKSLNTIEINNLLCIHVCRGIDY